MALISNHYLSNWSHVLFWLNFSEMWKEKKGDIPSIFLIFWGKKKRKVSGIFFKKNSPHLDSDFSLVDLSFPAQ